MGYRFHAAGTADGAENIREAAYQLDLVDLDVTDAWKKYIPCPSSAEIKVLSEKMKMVIQHIDNS